MPPTTKQLESTYGNFFGGIVEMLVHRDEEVVLALLRSPRHREHLLRLVPDVAEQVLLFPFGNVVVPDAQVSQLASEVPCRLEGKFIVGSLPISLTCVQGFDKRSELTDKFGQACHHKD